MAVTGLVCTLLMTSALIAQCARSMAMAADLRIQLRKFLNRWLGAMGLLAAAQLALKLASSQSPPVAVLVEVIVRTAMVIGWTTAIWSILMLVQGLRRNVSSF